ncbi:MAG: sel1 repeat family protein [Burkholderiaceae bacterium]|nr:sel1 repeat family protein [Burkholderiaceae bacterium]
MAGLDADVRPMRTLLVRKRIRRQAADKHLSSHTIHQRYMKKLALTAVLALGLSAPALAQNAASSAAASTESVSAELSRIRAAAERGDVDAQNKLGVMFQKGLGVAKNDAQAVVWYRKAAEKGLAYAQFNLGSMYQEGKGVARNEKLAVAWFRRAAEQELTHAQSNLGLMYAQGRGVVKDCAQAIIWWNKAGEKDAPSGCR